MNTPHRDAIRHRARTAVTGLAVIGLLAAAPASAQTAASVGVGGGVAYYAPIDDFASDSLGFALVYRLGKPQGFRPTFGFNWYSTEFDTTIAGERVEFGRLHIRPVMAGYGYWFARDRITVAATFIGGIAFNSFDTADAVRLAYDRRLDELLLHVSASNGLAGRAEVGVWYDLTSRLGLLTSVGYVAVRPSITIATESVQVSRRLRADAVKFQVGLVYGLF